MSDEVHIVNRTPPMTAAPAPLPLEPEPREHIEITLVGGPHHGQKHTVWTELRNLELPIAATAPEAEVPVVTVDTEDDGQGGEVTVIKTERTPLPVQASVVAVYTRESTEATTAVFSDYRLEA